MFDARFLGDGVHRPEIQKEATQRLEMAEKELAILRRKVLETEIEIEGWKRFLEVFAGSVETVKTAPPVITEGSPEWAIVCVLSDGVEISQDDIYERVSNLDGGPTFKSKWMVGYYIRKRPDLFEKIGRHYRLIGDSFEVVEKSRLMD